MTTSGHYRDMVAKEITAEVKRAWTYYQYAYNICALYKSQIQLADRLQKAGMLRYEQGDITALQRNMTTSLAADIRTKLMKAEEELQIAGRRFGWACYSSTPILPSDTALVLMTQKVDLALSNAHLQYFRSMANEKQAAFKLEKSKFYPEFSVGYVRQKIAPLTGLNSWMVGMSFPLFFGAQASRTRQAHIDAMIANTEAEDNIRMLNNKVAELNSKLKQEQENINYYQKAALPEAESLLKNAQVQFKESETDIVEFVQSINSAYEIRSSYTNAVYDYNVSLIELELYTEQ